MKKFVLLAGVCISTCSCLADKANGSPIQNWFQTSEKVDYKEVERAVSKNAYAAEISRLLAKMPNFKDKELNSEVRVMKNSLNAYLTTFVTYNKNQQRRSLIHFKNSYKKIQLLRSKNKYPDDFILNTYLVKLKNNMSHLESGI